MENNDVGAARKEKKFVRARSWTYSSRDLSRGLFSKSVSATIEEENTDHSFSPVYDSALGMDESPCARGVSMTRKLKMTK
jgi:hypothetical protein